MTLSELILAVGDNNVVFQNLLNDAETVNKTKHGTKITFYTDQVAAEELMTGDSGQTKKLGLVVWLPRDLVNAAVERERDRAMLEASDA